MTSMVQRHSCDDVGSHGPLQMCGRMQRPARSNAFVAAFRFGTRHYFSRLGKVSILRTSYLCSPLRYTRTGFARAGSSCLLLGFIFFAAHLTQASAWDLKNGETIGMRPIAFDYESKRITFSSPDGAESRRLQSAMLSLHSQRRFLFTPIFHKSFPDNGWSRERYTLLAWFVLAPVAVLGLGFWVAGWLIAGKFNPITALTGFVGSWVVGATLVICYFLFAEMLEQGDSLILAGFGGAAILVAIYVSAIYSCSFFRGLGIFFFHIVAAICLSSIGMLIFDKTLPLEERERLWEDYVYRPVGMIS